MISMNLLENILEQEFYNKYRVCGLETCSGKGSPDWIEIKITLMNMKIIAQRYRGEREVTVHINCTVKEAANPEFITQEVLRQLGLIGLNHNDLLKNLCSK